MFNGIRPIGVTAEGGGRQRRPTAIANRYAPAPADMPPLPRTEETPVATVGATAAVTASAPAADSPLSPGTANPNAASGEGDDDNSPLAPNHLPFNGGTDYDTVPGEMDAAAQSFTLFLMTRSMLYTRFKIKIYYLWPNCLVNGQTLRIATDLLPLSRFQISCCATAFVSTSGYGGCSAVCASAMIHTMPRMISQRTTRSVYLGCQQLV